MTNRPHSRLLPTLLVALTVVFATAAVLNFQQRRSFRLPDDGVTWVDAKQGVMASRVDPQSPAARAGVRTEDRLMRINGTAVNRALDVTRILAGIGVWQKVSYGIVRDGLEITKPLIVSAVESNPAVYYFQWILGLAYLAIGVFVLNRQGVSRPKPMVRHFYVFCLASFVLYTYSYTGVLGPFDRFIYWADIWAILLVPPIFLHFCLIFPDSAKASRLRRALASVAYLPALGMLAVFHLAAAGLLTAELPLVELRFLVDRVPYALLGIEFVVGALVLNLGAGSLEDIAFKQQRKWLAYGTLWGVLPFVVFYIWPYVMGQVPGSTRSLSVFSLALIPIAFAYAIVKYRLMDVDIIFRRGAAYSLATALLLGGFYGLVFLFGGLVQPQLNQLGPASWVISVVVAALMFHPLRNWIQQSLDRRFYQDRYDYRRTLVDFASALSTETNLDRMLSAVTERLIDALDLKRMAIFTVTSSSAEVGAQRFQLARGVGLTLKDLGEIEPGWPLDLRFLSPDWTGSNGHRPYLFFENPRLRMEYPAGARQTLAELDLNYYVPCRVHGTTIGYLGLGCTSSGDYLTSEDLSLVQAVSGYFAIALENARLYCSLEQKVVEYERLKDYNENIVESLHVGILAIDLDGRVESWNTPLELMFGISRQQAVSRHLEDLLPADLVAEFDHVRDGLGIHNVYKFRLRADAFPEEFRPTRHPSEGKLDAERILNVAIAPLVAKDFERIGHLMILDDITERVELEEQVVQADRLSSIGLLAAGVAHEVNTPLAVISSYAQMLAKRMADDPGQQKILKKITSQTFRASEIVNSLLNFSRTSTRDFAPLDLNQILGETVSLIEPQFRKAHITIETDFQPEAGPVRGNAGKLQQVFLNLLLNARDAMPEGGRVTLQTRFVEAADGDALTQVTISDTGTGISSEHLKRIFDPFFTTKGPKNGTGLGLAVSYGIVQEHSGKIGVESVAGLGTTFRVDLPLARKPIHA